jgi:hypothetical protein
MMTKTGDYQVKRPDLAREGAALRRAVRGELEWTRGQTKSTASDTLREPSKSISGADRHRKS